MRVKQAERRKRDPHDPVWVSCPPLVPFAIDVNSSIPLSSPALAAFIRGIERRALVVAEFQSGDVVVAERAVAVAMRAFVPLASSQAMTEWPVHYWSLLVSTPLLRQPGLDGRWPEDLAHLAVLPDGERLALLLRIGGGLDEPTAAAVLGVDVDAYCQSLALACPRDPDGQPDAVAWREIAESVQQRVRDLSEQRLEQLGRLREGLVTEEVDVAPVAMTPDADQGPAARRRQASRRQRHSGMGQWLWLLTGAALLAGLAWAWMNYQGGQSPIGVEGSVEDRGPLLPEDNPVEQAPLQELPLPPPVEPLPPEPLPEPAQAALLEEADFLAWVAAGAPMPADESNESPTTPSSALVASLQAR